MSSKEIIHLERVPYGVCTRKDTGEDVVTTTQNQTMIIDSATALYSGNVTCKRCKQWLKANKEDRKKMIHHG